MALITLLPRLPPRWPSSLPRSTSRAAVARRRSRSRRRRGRRQAQPHGLSRPGEVRRPDRRDRLPRRRLRHALAKDHEGDQIARWLNSLGIQAFVLQYRIAPRYHYPAPLLDAQRAIRFVRAHAADYRIAPGRIGIWGFSAGGHLASTTGTHFDAGDASAADPIDRASSRPDFMILAYPVISFTTPYTHTGSMHNLLGDNPDPKLVASLSNETQVTAQTPPTFLFHTDEDNGVPPENSVLFYLALRKAGVPAEMHIYERGPHGVGLASTDAVLASWAGRLKDWLEIRGLLQ
jgi:acetyl esterase/lipase